MVAGMASLPGSGKPSLGDKILKVARCRRARCARDADVVFGAQAALEAVDALLEHPGNGLFLALVQLSPHPFVEFCLGEIEVQTLDCAGLCFEDRICKKGQP